MQYDDGLCTVDKRDDDIHAGLQRGIIASETFNDLRLRLRDYHQCHLSEEDDTGDNHHEENGKCTHTFCKDL